MKLPTGNLFAALPARELGEEEFTSLWTRPGFRVERIVSQGQVTPAGQWYDQPWDEWVLVLRGAARLRLDGHPDLVELREGDWLLLPAHCRHRVEWTTEDGPTIWLAIHAGVGEEGGHGK
jgi:cupin 2 domain-containing protein